jgi:hypothetical protein
MGTRSLTFVYNDRSVPIINLYRQYDGYPSGHGRELADFLLPLTVGNGISGDTTDFANGMGCLAAQLVAHFKVTAGQFYLHSVKDTDCWQDYEYHVHKDRVVVKTYDSTEIFSGNWEAFSKFCSEKETG